MNSPRRGLGLVGGLALLYGMASLVHHLHNAIWLDDYPNMPLWLTPLRVMLAWMFVAGIGAAGGVLLYHGFRAAGYCALAVFAALGFCGLDHYAIARWSDHTAAMNGTILLEVATALALFLVVTFKLPRLGRARASADAAQH